MALKRARQPMPSDVRQALQERRLEDAYAKRPAYQRSDYLGWIASAKRPETRSKRLHQMLDELSRSGIYMNMAWNGPRTSRGGSQ